MGLKLWRIYQEVNDGYDTYDCAIVAAPDMETARRMHPLNGKLYSDGDDWERVSGGTWAYHPDQVGVELIGDAASNIQGVICASFNAG